MKRKLNETQVNEVIELYKSGESSIKLGKKYSVTDRTIRMYLLKNNVTVRTWSQAAREHTLNQSFFECIDNEKKAYWLGYMYADGVTTICSHKAKNKKIYSSKTISLTSIDYEVIEGFNAAMEYSGKITKSTRIDTSYYKVCITSDKLFDDLQALGCIERKSLVLQFPTINQVPLRLIPHFIRGYFDGDGSVSVSCKSLSTYCRLTVSICGTNEFLTELRETFSFMPNNMGLYKEKRRVTNTWNLRFDSRKAIQFYKYIYEDSTIYLQRKKDKFDNYFKERRSTTIIENPQRRIMV